jgi:outer membrane protein OmpA-like peptidoglycan-associated protein
MKSKIVLSFLISFLVTLVSTGQTETYTIKKASFSSDYYDEFSPVYYRGGIVFCSNRNPNTLMSYSTDQTKGLFKIYYTDTTGNPDWRRAELFSKILNTKFNDGPSTFSRSGDTIYFSRNQQVEGSLKEISNPKNRLGVFYSVLLGKTWTKPREFRANNEYYNITTPYLSPDGRRIFFASDKPGGYGGSDIYYCQWKKDYWDNPVNLGPVINTKGNEAYPFVNPDGELYFSSDGHPGLGGKDIYITKFVDTAWLEPVRLDPPVNSKFDDFGIITDSLMNGGYFSSNRDKSIDIYLFKTLLPQIFFTNIQKENKYCFIFSDTGSIKIDTVTLKNVWDFGDGVKAQGEIVNHCFKGSGKYDIELEIFYKATGKLFFSKLSYSLELNDFKQPYIDSPDLVLAGESVEFNGSKSFLPGYAILNYTWNFGDGTRAQGERTGHSFIQPGEYVINMGVTIKSELSGNISRTAISKKIKVAGNNTEKIMLSAKADSSGTALTDIRKYKNAVINEKYSAEKELLKDAIFKIELLSSEIRISNTDNLFKFVPKKYKIEEDYDSRDSTFRYFCEEQLNLMETVPSYREIIDDGYNKAVVRLVEIKDPAKKELHSLTETFGTSSDSYFNLYDRLTPNAYIMLDQIVRLMNKYANVRLEVAVHTDKSDLYDKSQMRAQIIINYLINRGINTNRLTPAGYGSSKPVSLGRAEAERKLNRRIIFSLSNQ